MDMFSEERRKAVRLGGDLHLDGQVGSILDRQRNTKDGRGFRAAESSLFREFRLRLEMIYLGSGRWLVAGRRYGPSTPSQTTTSTRRPGPAKAIRGKWGKLDVTL